MTAFSGIVDKAKLSAGEYIAVHGCGGVGLSAIMIARALGASVIALDIDTGKLELAKSLGANHVIDARDAKPHKVIQSLTDGGAHVSIDALGSSVTSANSISSLRKRGRHVQIGLMLAEDAWAKLPMYQVIAKELQIIGSHGMQAWRYPEMLKMIAEGKLEPKKLIGKTLSLEEAGAELVKMGEFAQQGVSVIDRFA
jgi:alcohol dehydrogenase